MIIVWDIFDNENKIKKPNALILSQIGSYMITTKTT